MRGVVSVESCKLHHSDVYCHFGQKVDVGTRRATLQYTNIWIHAHMTFSAFGLFCCYYCCLKYSSSAVLLLNPFKHCTQSSESMLSTLFALCVFRSLSFCSFIYNIPSFRWDGIHVFVCGAHSMKIGLWVCSIRLPLLCIAMSQLYGLSLSTWMQHTQWRSEFGTNRTNIWGGLCLCSIGVDLNAIEFERRSCIWMHSNCCRFFNCRKRGWWPFDLFAEI